MKVARMCWLWVALVGAMVAYGAPSAREAEVRQVLVMFKTHLDVGFTDLSSKVTERYLTTFIPKAMETIERLEAEGGEARYVWTTGAWLIDRYLRTASPDAAARLEGRLRRGSIAWTAMPYTVESESVTRPFFEGLLRLSGRLDARYGRKTAAAQMTDVPGHTRGIVEPLCEAGVTTLFIGVNPASAAPNVPPICRWRAPSGKEVILIYQGNYGETMVLPDGKTALSMNFTGDNHGPHAPEHVKALFAALRKRFPNATLTACTFNDVARCLEPMRERLPVVTAEIGDTWIYGFASAPRRMAKFRALMACHARWVATGALAPDAKEAIDFVTELGLIAEHTWGVDVKTHLRAWDCYTPEAFQAARATPPFRLAERSWAELDAYLTSAVDALPAPLRAEAKAAMAAVERPVPAATPEAKPWQTPLPGGVGAVSLCYQTLAPSDYERFFARCLRARYGWALSDFGKPGLERTPAVSALRPAVATGALEEATAAGKRVTRDVTFPAGDALTPKLLPRRTQVSVVSAPDGNAMELTVTLLDKPAVRLPEAYWVRFDVPGLRRVLAQKVGAWVDVLDVVERGARRRHGVDGEVRLVTAAGTLTIRPREAFLLNVSPEPGLSYDTTLPDLSGGVQFCLLNNFWGANFAMWCEGTMAFHFDLTWAPCR